MALVTFERERSSMTMQHVLDRYCPQDELGRGAWGVVYLAHDPLTREELALKRCHRTEANDIKLLKQEFRRVRSLQHPNLVRLYELVVDEGGAFFTMEFVPGHDLDVALTKLPPRGMPTRAGKVVSIARQLIEAVLFLHDHGVLHRDLKPSNIRVTPQGRVRLLDFGLSASLKHSRRERGSRVGSLKYMAPECVFGAAHSPASDVYGVGMLLWQLVRGEGPFPDSTPRKNLEAKRRGPSLPQGESSVLLQLAARMLEPRPDRRPSLTQALSSLGVDHGRVEAPFVGRTDEMTFLREAIEAPGGRVVHVHGPPGIGKSRLIEEALRRSDLDFEIVRARCHPDEAVPFRAIDGLIDELSQLFWRRPPSSFGAVEPAARAGLCEIFGVLRSVPGLGPATVRGSVDARERRRAAVQGLVQLVTLAAEETSLVLWIDDLHWGDADSEPFLAALLETENDAKIVLSYRWPEPTSSILSAIRERSASLHELAVPPLNVDESRLLGKSLGLESELTESDGRPGWIEEVARLGTNTPFPRSMNDAVKQRSEHLSLDQKELLELVLLDRPIETELLLRAAQSSAPRRTLDELESTRWIRRTSAGLVDTWHDRIHDALASDLDPARRRSGHSALARALLAGEMPRPRRVATHLERADLGVEAVRWYERAAIEARQQLAFEQAARDYEAVLRLDPDGPWTRQQGLAEVLDLAGRSADAGQRYLVAARCRGVADADERRLLLLAGTRLLYGGQLDTGIKVITELLSNVGVNIPTRPMVTGLFERLRFIFSRGHFIPRSDDQIPARGLTRAQTIIDAAGGLFMVAPLVADALAVRGLREALRLGHNELVIKALGFECSSEANIGGAVFRGRAAALLQQLQVLTKQTGEPLHTATAMLTEGTVAFFENRWQHAVTQCRAAYRRFVEDLPGSTHAQNAAMAFHVAALGASGRILEMREPLVEYRQAAEARGDRYAQVAMATAETFWPDLADDAPERALERANKAMAAWPAREFSSPHYQHAFLEVTCFLYQEQHRRAEARLEDVWPELRRHGFLGLEWLGHQLRYLRGRVALACAREPGAKLLEVRRWRRRAARMARKLARSSLPGVEAFQTALAHGLGDVASYDRVSKAFELADMPAYTVASRLLAARGGGNREAEQQHRAALETQGVRAPLRFALSLIPTGTAQ